MMRESREPTDTITLSVVVAPSEHGTEPPVFLPQERVAGRFRIVRPLGVGGMGQVFEAEDLELGTRVALKVIRPQATRSVETETLFRREVHLARRVTHPHVCRMFDLVVHHPGEAGTAWGEEGRPILGLTMELLEGRTLADHLRCRGPLPPVEALKLLRQMAAALDAAHDVGVYHCDFKPSNVILTPSRAVVTDFGLARSAWGEDGGSNGPVRGTPGYVAPEVMAGGQPTAAADRYALGVVAHRVLTGRLPTEESSADGPEVELPAEARAVLARAMHPEPEGRYPRAVTLVDALESTLPAPSAARRPWLTAALLLFMLLSLMTTIGWHASSQADQPAAEEHLDEARLALGGSDLDYPRGRAAATRALVTAQATADPEAEAQAHLLLAKTLEAMGKPSRADEAMARAVRLLEASGDRCGLARASLVFRDTADLERSPLPLEDLPSLLAECDHPTLQALALARLAKRRMQTDVVEGERMLRRALALAQGSDPGDPKDKALALAEAWNVLGALEYGKEDLHASEAAFARAAAEARRAENPYMVAGILCNQSSLLSWLGRDDEARVVLQEAVSLARRIDNRYLLNRALRMEAGHHLREGHLTKAELLLEEAYRLSLDLGDARDIRLSLGRLASVHAWRGDWDRALEWLRKMEDLPVASPVQQARYDLQLARLLLKSGETGQAEALVTRVMDEYPLEEDADSTALYSRFLRVQIHLYHGETAVAANLFQRILPHLVRKDEVGLRRDAAHLAVELDRRLAEPRVVTAWRRLATAIPAAAAASPERLDLVLQLRADLGRLLWFQGDEAGAAKHFRSVARQARSLGRGALTAQLAGERRALERWDEYWRW